LRWNIEIVLKLLEIDTPDATCARAACAAAAARATEAESTASFQNQNQK
jgi:hypothetical protein